MDVSVIIPLYNGEQWIEETLESVLDQSHTPRDIVVVDDGSTDRSPRIAQSYTEVTLVPSPADEGAGAARDFGLDQTTAPLVAFLDQDDIWHPAHLRNLAGMLEENDQHPAAVAEADTFEPDAAPNYNTGSDRVEPFDPWNRFPLNSIPSPSCVLIRRSALEDIGGWPHQFAISDVHGWFKLTAVHPMIRSRKVTVGKRYHPESALHTLRENPLYYLEQSVKVYEDVLDYKKRVGSGETGRYERRLEIFKSAAGVLRGLVTDDEALVEESARQLEQPSRTDEESTVSIWLLVLWQMRSEISPADWDERCTVLHRLINTWPDNCRHARKAMHKALARTMSGWSFASCLYQQPHRVGAWHLLLEVLRVRARKKLT